MLPRGWLTLAGPTGEADLYALVPRDAVLCLADDEADLLAQLAAVLAAGSRAVWPSAHRALRDRLPEAERERVSLADDWLHPAVRFDAVLHHGTRDQRLAVARQLAGRPGAIVGLQGLDPGDRTIAVERLVVERSASVNTAAAGGNASLMTIG